MSEPVTPPTPTPSTPAAPVQTQAAPVEPVVTPPAVAAPVTPPVQAPPVATPAPAQQTPPASGPDTPAAIPEDPKVKAEREAKEWLKMAYPENFLEDDTPKPKPLDLNAPATPPGPATGSPPAQPSATAATPPAPAAAPSATPQPDPLKVTKRKPSPEIEEIVKQTVAATVAATTPKPPTKPAPVETPKEPEIDLTNWDPEEIRLLRTYQYAEKDDPKKYAGLVKGLQADKAKIEDYRAKAVAEDPNWNESDDERFQAVVSSIKPRLNAREVAELDEARILSEAERRVAAKQEGKFREIEKVQRELQLKPVVENTVVSFATNMAKQFAEKREGKPDSVAEIAARYNEVGDAILQENRLTAPIVVDTLKRATALATEFTRLEQHLDEFDPKNPRHAWLVGFMQHYDRQAASLPAEKKVRVVNGVQQTFIPRNEYNRIADESPDQLGQYWTHSTVEYLAALGVNAEREAAQKVSEFEELLTKDGYRREPPKPTGVPKPTNTTPAPQEMKPTLPTSAPAPGPGASASIKTGTPFMDEETLKLLGYK